MNHLIVIFLSSYKTVDIMCTVRAEHLFPDKKNGVSVEKDKKATQDLVEKVRRDNLYQIK